MDTQDLTFLKLGGSLITDKNTPSTPRGDVLERLAQEIAQAHRAHPQMRLILGHGSGSFGHMAARKHNTRKGVKNAEGWLGFAEVWKEARALNQIVVDALSAAGLPVIAFPPSAAVTAHSGQVKHWDLRPMQAALDAGLVPLINGDTIFDEELRGTILSTEDLFIYLAHQLHPQRILLAGIEAGVWADFPNCINLVEAITPANFAQVSAQIGGSASVDVTGGMLEKVRTMLGLAKELPGFRAVIFSGTAPGNVQQALSGQSMGTIIYQPD